MTPSPNRLIEDLPRADRVQFLAASESVPLALGDVLCRPGERTRHAYFPTDGFISLLSPMDAEPGIEVGMVGREGMLGVQLALGVGAVPLQALVQGEGTAQRISAAAFRRQWSGSPALRRSMGRYVYVLMAQLATSAACTRFHQVQPRLARWLLMTHDRVPGDTFHLTHEFLARMLGVRRAGITAAATGLHQQGLIGYRRGEITVLDRPGLEVAACSCYASDARAYDAMTAG